MLSKFFGDQRGTIGVLSALTIVAVIGFSALAVEFGHGLLQREEDQRVADLAAYGGALVYNSSSGSTDAAAAAAANVARLNGLPAGAAASLLVNSPTNDGNQAMRVTVSTNVPLLLARVLTKNTTLPVSATAFAEIKSGAPGCIIALSSGGTGVTVSSAATITADNCAVASNASVTAASASKIVTKVVDYGTTYSTSGASSIDPPAGTPSVRYSKTATLDPLSGNTEVTTATGRLGTVSAITPPSGPSVSAGTPLTLNLLSKSGSLPAGCSTTSTASPWAITCTGTAAAPSAFGALTVTGATTATITNAVSGAGYTFSGPLNVSSASSLTFTGGSNTTYKIAGGIAVASSSGASFGAGSFQISASSSTCNGVLGYSTCNTGGKTLSFAGPSTFVLGGGIYNGSSSTLTMGSGSSSNSYNIGAAADGNSINANITSVILGDATGANDIFQTAGSIIGSGSNSLTLPAAIEHDIHGDISVSSATTTTLGAGVYTVTGYVAVGSSSGAATLTGSASGVTLVIGGASTPSSSPCSGMAFCVADASHVTLTAPASGATEDLAVVGPTSSSNTAGAVFAAAAGSSLSGAVYFPNGPVSVSDASGLGNGSGECLELIGSQVTVSGASAVGTTCTGLGGGGSSGGSVALVR